MEKEVKIGQELAENIFLYLKKNREISHNHYGYCGVGFVLQDSTIHYTHFDEWLSYKQGVMYVPGGEYTGIIRTFEGKRPFVDWLSEESDLSLSGIETEDQWYIGNQRITIKRLLNLLEREFSKSSSKV